MDFHGFEVLESAICSIEYRVFFMDFHGFEVLEFAI